MFHFCQNFQNAATPTDFIASSWNPCIFTRFTSSTTFTSSTFGLGHFGSQRAKDDFHKKCYKLSILHSMLRKVIHVCRLEIIYLCCCSQGSDHYFDIHFYSTLSWAWPAAGWEITLTRALILELWNQDDWTMPRQPSYV